MPNVPSLDDISEETSTPEVKANDSEDSPPASEDEGWSDDGEERETQDSLADMKKLDTRFTPKQLAYLNERKNTYRYGSANQRSELAQSTGEYFLKKIMTHGRDPSKEEMASLYDNVKLWYAQRARSRHGPMHWTINWTGRQVYYKENTDIVLETQRSLFKLATGKSSEESVVPPVDLELVGEPEEAIPSDPKKPMKLFHFFQRALTAQWKALTETQREEYEAKARVWREMGPSIEERRRLAEKEAGRVIHEFADEIFRQMGVRAYFLVSYEDTTGDHVAFSLDFNNQIGGGISFKQAERAYLEKVALEGQYAAFVRRTLPPEGQKGDKDQATKRPRKRGDPVPVDLNEFGEPIIPDISKLPESVKAHRYFPDLIRSIMRHDHACARGVPVGHTSSSPPWKDMAGNWRKWIGKDVWPDEWPTGDPGGYGVPNCRKMLQFWYDRQQRGEIPFQFHSYWVGGESWESRQPRQHASPNASDDDMPKKKRRGKKRAPKKPTKGGNTKKIKKAAQKAAPTSTARQSASVAMRRAPATPSTNCSKPHATTTPPIVPQLRPSRKPPAEGPEKPGAGKLKGRAKHPRVESSSEVSEGEKESQKEMGQESDGGLRLPRETPTLQGLVVATTKLALRTPSREGSVMSIGPDAPRADETQRDESSLTNAEGTRKGSKGKSRLEAPVAETWAGDNHEDEQEKEDEDAMEERDRKTRSRVRAEKLKESRERAERKRMRGMEANGEVMDVAHPDGESDVANDGGGNSTVGGEDPGSASGVSHGDRGFKRIPVEDRELLKSAARYIPQSKKRIARKKVQFGEPAAETKGRPRKRKGFD